MSKLSGARSWWFVVVASIVAACGPGTRSLTVMPDGKTVPVGTPVQFTANLVTAGQPAAPLVSGEATWSSSDMTVATIDANGRATTLGAGVTTVTAKYMDLSASATLTVTSASLVSIVVTPPKPKIVVGATQQFMAMGTFSDGTMMDVSAQVTWSSSDVSIATIDAMKGLATGVSFGGATITATPTGGGSDGGMSTVMPATAVLSVIGASVKTIAVSPAMASIGAGTTKQFVATATYSDGTNGDVTGNVTWSSSDMTIATISNTAGSKGSATGVAKGSATITATSGAVTATAMLTVTGATLASIAVSPTNPVIAKGSTQQFVATGTFSDMTTQDLSAQVTWSTSDMAVATVTMAGLATGVAKGNTTVTAALGGISGTTVLLVSDVSLMSIAVNPAMQTIASGTTQQFTATGTYSDMSTQDLTSLVTWSSSSMTVATVSNTAGSKGLVTSVMSGMATITATFGGIMGSAALTVSGATLASISVTPTGATITKGTTQQFTATGIYSDKSTQDLTTQVTWASSTMGVALISNAMGIEGLATAVSNGQSTITATLGMVSGTTILVVNDATLMSITVTPTNSAISKGTFQQFKATGNYSDKSTQDITSLAIWVSSQTTVATISNASGSVGRATGVNPGSTTIAATAGGITGSTILNVTAASLASITVTPTNPVAAKGTTRQFSATGNYSDNSTQDLTLVANWTTSAANIASVSNANPTQGVATAVATGQATITATFKGVSGATLLTVSGASLATIAVTPGNSSLAKGSTRQFVATGTYSDNTTQDLTSSATWASSMGNIASVSNAAGSRGLVTAASQGMTQISATFVGITGMTTLTVSNATLTSIALQPTNPVIAKGTTQQLSAVGTYSDKSTQDITNGVNWTSTDNNTATVSNSAGSQGLATGVAVGQVTVTASFGGVSGSTSLIVSNASLVAIGVTPTNPTIAKGTQVQFTATGTYSDKSTQDVTSVVTWASATGAVANVSNAAGQRGLATGLAQGQTLISATVGGTTGSTNLTVTSATLSTIAVTPTNPSIAKGTQQQFTATGTYSDGTTQDLTMTATWASSMGNIAAVSNAAGTVGLASALAQGQTQVSATLGAVSGATTLTVSGATLTGIAVTPTNPSIAKGTQIQLSATGTYSDNSTQDITSAATWASSMGAVATVSNSAGSRGLVDGVSQGMSSISASLSGVTGMTNVTITNATLASISVTPTNPAVAKGTTQQFTATGTYTDKSTQDLTPQVTWASSDNTIAMISNAAANPGLASALATGQASISASLNGLSGATVMTVSGAALQSIAVTPPSPTIAKGTTQQFVATGTYSDMSTQDITTLVTWSSTDTMGTNVASVSNAAGQKGLATGTATGTATITAALTNVKGSTTLSVSAATLTSISIDPASQTIAKGTGQQYKATGFYSDKSTQDLTTQVTWASSMNNVATVSNSGGSQGLATAVAKGVTSISAGLNGVTGTTGLTVTDAVLTGIAVDQQNPSVALGTTFQFTATGTYSDTSTQDVTSTATWSSSDGTVATVSNASGQHGLAKGVAQGKVTVTAAIGGVNGATGFTVTGAVLQSISIQPTTPLVAKGTTQQFTATGIYSDNSVADLTTQVNWSSDNTAVASISNATGTNGLATAVGAGQANIGASLSGVSSSTVINVSAATLQSIAVTPGNVSIAAGTQDQLTATGTYSDNSTQDITSAVSWSSSSSGVASVSNSNGTKGLVTGVAASNQAATITAQLGAVSGTATVTVTQAVLSSIALVPQNAKLPVGFSLQYKAVGTFSDNSTQDITQSVTWSSSNPNIVFIDNAPGSRGLASASNTGQVNITATRGAISSMTPLTATNATLIGISITPAGATVRRGANQQYTATGNFSDGSMLNITTQVTWGTTRNNIIRISNAAGSKGLATAVGTGPAQITARNGAVQNAVNVTVQ